MPQLIINQGAPGWQALIANTDPVRGLAFAGDTLDDQYAEVQRLAEAMRGGPDAVDAVILNVFEGAPDIDPALLTADIFATTDEIVLETAVIFTATEGASLLEEIVAAGAALAAVL